MNVPPNHRDRIAFVLASCFAWAACGSESPPGPSAGPAPAPSTGAPPSSRPPAPVSPPAGMGGNPEPTPGTSTPPAPTPPPSPSPTPPPATTPPPVPGMPGRWSHSKTITLDTTPAGANVMQDVSKYPLAVQLDESRFDFTQAQPSGADIRFFDAAGKALPHAIQSWDREAKKAAVWVLLDVVKASSSDQSIVMKWGNPGAPDASDSKAVFKRADGFVGVWHLDEDGNTEANGYKDASDHEAHGTGVGMVAGLRVDGRVGKGVHLENPSGQNTARWIRVDGEKATQFNPGPPITVSLWMQGHSYPIQSYETMMSKGDTSWTLQRVRYGSGQGYQSCVRTPGYHLCAYNFGRQPLVTRQWLHFMLVLQEPNMKLYINGQLNSEQNAGPWNKGAHPLGIGNQTQALGGRRQWDGFIDEARVMQVARPPAWARLEFESQKENQTLMKFGATRTEE